MRQLFLVSVIGLCVFFVAPHPTHAANGYCNSNGVCYFGDNAKDRCGFYSSCTPTVYEGSLITCANGGTSSCYTSADACLSGGGIFSNRCVQYAFDPATGAVGAATGIEITKNQGSGNTVVTTTTTIGTNADGSSIKATDTTGGSVTPSPVITGASKFFWIPMESSFISEKNAILPNLLTFLFNTAIIVVGISALVMITIGGITYILAAGNVASTKSAKDMITDAVIGLLLAFFAWLILFTINPDLVGIGENLEKIFKARLTINTQGSGGGRQPVRPTTTGTTTGTPTTGSTTAGYLNNTCKKYDAAFTNAAQQYGVDKCLLYAVATQESGGCTNTGTSSAGASGIMQITSATAKSICGGIDAGTSEGSIACGAKVLATYASLVAKYGASGYTQSGSTQTVAGYTFDTGNANLLAAYNGGYGSTSVTGKLGAFASSQMCSGALAWQCQIAKDGSLEGKSGFYETRDYVTKVQNYQRECVKNQ